MKLLLLAVQVCSVWAVYPHAGKKDCVPLNIETCMQFNYNSTRYPNILGHTSQKEAERNLFQFRSLIKVGCSHRLAFFLCAIYAQPCTILDHALPPCRGLCQEARDGCEKLMNSYNFKWPEPLDCSNFPAAGLCIQPNNSDSDKSKDNKYNGSPHHVYPNKPFHEFPVAGPGFNPGPYNPNLNGPLPNVPLNISAQAIKCPAPLRVPTGHDYRLYIDNLTLNDCGAPCSDDWFFSASQRQFARLWIGCWAIVCLCSTLFTVLTFIIDRQRFKYPERPIIFLSACYLVVAACYVSGFALGSEVSCNTKFDPSKPLTSIEQMEQVTVQGTKREPCTILFMLLYFFQMASAIWWVLLTLTWFLAAGLKWGHEAIEANSQYFHLAAWAVPAVQTIAVLALQQVDGDVLAGVCYTGLSDVRVLRGFIIAPLLVYELLGACFLLAGLISLFRIRTIMKADGSPGTDKLEKLMLRIGLFSVLYLVPATALLGCQLHEQAARGKWWRAWLLQRCSDAEQDCSNSALQHLLFALNLEDAPRPEFSILMIKYVMTLIVGVTSGFWVWSGKTLQSWRKLYCCVTQQPEAGYTAPQQQLPAEL